VSQDTLAEDLRGAQEDARRVVASPHRGKTLPLLTDEMDCPDCEGNGECFECSGTGQCLGCDGDGKAESARAYCNALYWDNGVQQRCDRRAPGDADERWQCDEHKRQAAWLKQRAAS
jgi:hypothetical protein